MTATPQAESETPRTDAVAWRDDFGMDEYVRADFARQLERELAALRQEVERLRAVGEEIRLLTDVLSLARTTLLVSIKGTPDALQHSLSKLNLACKAHWDWQTTKIAALSASAGGEGKA